jgi:hypothetical protein
LASAQSGILFEWQGSNGDATDPKTIDVDCLLRVNVFDLNIRIVDQRDSVVFESRVYRNPGNSYSYLPFGSFHDRHITSGWLKAELQRLLTHSSTLEIWMEESSQIYEHFRRRGCRLPSQIALSSFRPSVLVSTKADTRTSWEVCLRKKGLIF